jgi:hypothetical protein
MTQGEIIHPVSGANFNNYWYTSILVPSSTSVTINGVTLPTTVGPIILPIGVANASQISGNVFLIGGKKFGATSGTTIGFWENPLSSDKGNSPGSFSIK